MNESEKTFLLVTAGADFGTRSKMENGEGIVKLNWSAFQEVVITYYQLGKDSINPKQKED